MAMNDGWHRARVESAKLRKRTVLSEDHLPVIDRAESFGPMQSIADGCCLQCGYFKCNCEQPVALSAPEQAKLASTLADLKAKREKYFDALNSGILKLNASETVDYIWHEGRGQFMPVANSMHGDPVGYKINVLPGVLEEARAALPPVQRAWEELQVYLTEHRDETRALEFFNASVAKLQAEYAHAMSHADEEDY